MGPLCRPPCQPMLTLLVCGPDRVPESGGQLSPMFGRCDIGRLPSSPGRSPHTRCAQTGPFPQEEVLDQGVHTPLPAARAQRPRGVGCWAAPAVLAQGTAGLTLFEALGCGRVCLTEQDGVVQVTKAMMGKPTPPLSEPKPPHAGRHQGAPAGQSWRGLWSGQVSVRPQACSFDGTAAPFLAGACL